MKKINIVIDFDSTFVTKEALDELANIVLQGHDRKNTILSEIKDITKQGMEGILPFDQSLAKRLKLFRPHKKHIHSLIQFLKQNLTPSIEQNKQFIRNQAKNIYIISGGFKEYIYPVVRSFGISQNHILANEFLFDKQGWVSGFDKKNCLSQAGGKINAVKQLKLAGDIWIIGDGYTDFQIKQSGNAQKFYYFSENVMRETVASQADRIVDGFTKVVELFHNAQGKKVLLLENINQEAANLFEKQGYEVELLTNSLSEEALIGKITDIEILGIRSKTKVTPKVLEAATSLKAIGAYCIGTDQINLEEAKRRNIYIANDPFSNTRSVVELVIGEIIMLARRAFDASTKMHAGIWEKSSTGCFEIRGKTLGIIGYGSIGTQLSCLAESLGMQVIFFDVFDRVPYGNAKRAKTLTELLVNADVVSVHVDGRPINRHLIGEREFQVMKKGVVLLNLSRGSVVDLSALLKNVNSGKIAGVGLDVFPDEPEKNGSNFLCKLQKLPNVILTPHIGGSTQEAQKNIGIIVTKKLINYLEEEER